MSYKVLIFGTDDFYPKLKPHYNKAVTSDILEIVGIVDDTNKLAEVPDFDFVIISAHKTFYQRIHQLTALGVPHDKIIDGRVFQMPSLDFQKFLEEGVAYGVLKTSTDNTFVASSRMIYPRVYRTENGKAVLSVGVKSYIMNKSSIAGRRIISLGKYSSFAEKSSFSLGRNHTHNYQNVGTVPTSSLDWVFPKKFLPQRGTCKILIGNDVWSGHSCTFKCNNPKKPLIIGDGAVIASESVVVKNVPPYAIVGGNPAKIIKFRFSEDIIEALLRIKWWDWSLEKLRKNFKYFNDVERFTSLHDK